jgi:2-polyprenyl-6-methoxyphenol hydroxylase-like FAD-dependent oxidoreductase
MSHTREKSALVIGGSMAGLLTARILSDHFGKVTIIERDLVHDFPESRKGQPHTAHVHGLLVQGFKIVSRYFPDLLEGLQSGGSPLLDMAQNMRWYCHGGYRARFEFGLKGVITSRPFLEWHIRQRVQSLSNITIKDGYSAERLLASDNSKQITGLQVKRTGTDTKAEEIQADLIVDASGRGSRSPRWLEELGYGKPAETSVGCGAGYATRLYARDTSQPGSQDWIFVTPQAPRESRMGAAFPVEDNKWILGLAGWHGDHAPTDEEGFIKYAKSLPAPDIYHIATTATPLSDIVTYKFAASLRHHYEKMERFPRRFLIGDAVCSFNPVYGQGMTSAAMQAAALDTLLKEHQNLDDITKPYFKKIARIVDIPWQTAVGEDFRFPQTKGKKAPGTDFINAYIDRVHRATHHDPVVGAAFLKVMNMIEPPASLLSPAILWRVLRNKAPRQPAEKMVTA